MAMPVTLRRFTLDELDAFRADGNRYELVGGLLLVTPLPGPAHQTVVSRLMGILLSVFQDDPWTAVWSPGAIRIPPELQLEPDILVGRMPRVLERWEDVVEHWLAIEVSGAPSRVYDRDYTQDAYLEVGVREVWRVDLDSRSISISRQGEELRELRGEVSWRSPTGRELRVGVEALFRGR